MRVLIILLLSLFFTSLMGQNYYPPKRENVSEATYEKYSKRLKNQYNSIERHTDMNIALAYAYLGERDEVVFNQIQKAIDTAPSISCIIVGMNVRCAKQKEEPFIYETINKNKWDSICNFCDSVNNIAEQTTINANASDTSLNQDLIEQLQQLSNNDSKMRSQPTQVHNSKAYKSYWKEQNRLDSINQVAIRAIIQKHGYPGKSLVGQANENIVAFVIQHAPLNMQEEYLPVILKAQKEDEIDLGLVYLLVDRIHLKKYGKQIFGTQQIWDDGLQRMITSPLYSEKEIIIIKKQYNLE
jgi:hypothetical protein